MTFPDLIKPLYEWKERQWNQRPVRSNTASMLGGDCVRELVYWRTSWEQATPPPRDLKVIFQEGSKHEDAILAELRAAGIQVIEQQVSLEWKEYNITAHLDATCPHEGQSLPVECKSMSPHIFDSCFKRGAEVYPWEEVSDAFRRKSWLRKYLGQITIYCLLRNSDAGILLCINKATGEIAQVNVPLDYEYGELLIARAVEINGHVEAGTLPERIAFDENICPRCSFYSMCLPEQIGREPIAFLDDATVESLLVDRALYIEAGRKFDTVDKRIHDWAKARSENKIQIGRWLITKKPHGKGTRVIIQEVIPEEAEVAAADAGTDF
jgi:hypothetical protein